MKLFLANPSLNLKSFIKKDLLTNKFIYLAFVALSMFYVYENGNSKVLSIVIVCLLVLMGALIKYIIRVAIRKYSYICIYDKEVIINYFNLFEIKIVKDDILKHKSIHSGDQFTFVYRKNFLKSFNLFFVCTLVGYDISKLKSIGLA